MDERTSKFRLGLALCFVVASFAIVDVLLSTDAVDRAIARPTPEAAARRESRALDAPSAWPRGDASRAAIESNPTSSSNDDSPAARVEFALGRLASELQREPFSRVDWQSDESALSRILGDEARARLIAIAESGEVSIERRVLALELARASAPETFTASAELVELLRNRARTIARTIDGGDGGDASDASDATIDPGRCVAERALAALGTDADRDALADRWMHAKDDGARASAAWALSSAPFERLQSALLARMREGGDDRMLELGLTTLDACGPHGDRSGLDQFALELVRDRARSTGVVRRALHTLASSDDAAAIETLENLWTIRPELERDAADALASNPDARGAELLRNVAADCARDPRQRLSALEALEHHGLESAEERECLRAIASDAEDATLVRRALTALAPRADARDRSIAARRTSDADSRVARTAQRILAGEPKR